MHYLYNKLTNHIYMHGFGYYGYFTAVNTVFRLHRTIFNTFVQYGAPAKQFSRLCVVLSILHLYRD